MIHAFYSDPHFGHAKIIEGCARPFRDIAHMADEMVSRYNAVVGPSDVVVWVGDCFFGPVAAAEDVMARLNGRKVLVRGNHDKGATRMARFGFDLVADELTTTVAGYPVRICHYPYAGSSYRGGAVDARYLDRRPPRVRGEVLVHGHTHSPRRRDGNMVHVGVDAWDYAPAPYAAVAQLVADVFSRGPS